MDVIGGLTAAKLASDLAKDLREFDKSVDEATYKMKLAELMSALADTQIAFAEAKTQINELVTEVDTLKNGSLCPICKNGTLSVAKVEPSIYSPGSEFHHCRCTNDECDYKTKRLFDSSICAYTSNSK